jgi:hypothetical protein
MATARDDRHYALVVATFATVLFLALAVCASGLISLLTDSDVLPEKDAGLLVGPVMFATAAAAFFIALVRLGAVGARSGRSVILASLVTGILVYFVYCLSGATLYTLGSGQPLRGVLFFGANSAAPVAIAVGILAIVVAFAFLLLLAYRRAGGVATTPRWPWERGDDESRRTGR